MADWDTAAALYSDALTEEPDSARLRLNRSLVLSKQGETVQNEYAIRFSHSLKS